MTKNRNGSREGPLSEPLLSIHVATGHLIFPKLIGVMHALVRSAGRRLPFFPSMRTSLARARLRQNLAVNLICMTIPAP